MSKQQVHMEMRLSAKAAFGAVRQYFSGTGAKGRTATFLKKIGVAFVYLVSGFIAITSWAIVGGLLIGPGHEDALRSLHAWMIETPVDQVVARGNALVSENAAQYLASALLIAVMWRLGDVTQPAIAKAKLRYRAKVAEQSGDTPQAATHN
ncbi:hypothetical protein [Pseudomonas sp. P9(2020)]|uniref:hypothetical protein n=1 Tax=Pseudomonas sp. P9(2020) TaxID=2763316 RepID=UPI001B32F21D|nr:hypothetical protein [Pseudomonas sp. P9(2020)]